MSYQHHLNDILFNVKQVADLARVQELPGYEDATSETVDAVLEENAKFCNEVIAPLNKIGDQQPSSWQNGQVTTTPGFKKAYQAYAESGWQGIQHPVQFGGQGLPKLVATPCIEMLNAANLSFALCPLLTDGAIEALITAGNPTQQQIYLPKLISGAWSGTMNLTEPQAGSDLAMVRTRAVPQTDGTYRLFGQKIFITYGEHDMVDNIVHLVLARTPNAPEGVKGISLFVVPKFLVNADGTLGQRNDVYCASIEHKLGIKASPTAVMLFGDGHGEVGAGAIGTLVGEENRGLEYMFIMMNAARFAVGMQGIAVAQRAYQQAVDYAKTRVQSRDLSGSSQPVTIIHHPDIKRLLMSMRAQIEAARALAYVAASASDLAHHHADPDIQAQQRAFYEYLVPIVKGWSTELSIDVTSAGVQVHGGMGFIEETGAAQHYRDARILSIYEGTTAIQANDLVGRKTVRNKGSVAQDIIAQIKATIVALNTASSQTANEHFSPIQKHLEQGLHAYQTVVEYVVNHAAAEVKQVFAGSVLYLKLAGIVLGGWQLARSALIAQQALEQQQGDARFYQAKIITARFFADHFLSQADGMALAITEGSVGTLGLEEQQF